MKKETKLIPIVLIVLSLACLGAGAVFFFWEHPELEIEPFASDSSASLETVSTEPSILEEIPIEEPEPEPELSKDEALAAEIEEALSGVSIQVNAVENPYKDWYLKNDDMVGWLKIPDTIVDFPVMWTPEDENYYLSRGFDKEPNKLGCLILDTDSSLEPLSTNLIIHGHNFKGEVFNKLSDYESQSYRDEHPYIYLYTKDYEHVYEVMAAFRSQVFYTTDTCFKYYKFFEANNEEEFNDFYDNVKEMSFYDSGVTASFGDRFITLSTCAYHTENGRFVVVAKEIEPGDTYLPIDSESNNEISSNE